MKSEIILGPYFFPWHGSGTCCTAVVPLGFGLEWATPSESKVVPLFGPRDHQPRNPIRLERVVFPVGQLPFTMECPSYQIIHGHDGPFAPLEALLVVLYRRFNVARSICELLTELAVSVPLHGLNTGPLLTSALLRYEAEKQGFRLNMLIHSDDKVFAEIAWKPRHNEHRFHVASCVFGPRDSEGKWITSRVIGVSQLLSDSLRQIAQGPPCSLFSEAGISLLRTSLLEKAV